MNLDEIERIINEDQIKNGGFVRVGNTPKIDMSTFSDSTIWRITQKGGWCFIPVNDDTYECHFGYTRKTSPFFAMNHSKECFAEMVELGAKRLIGMVPSENLLAKRFLEKIGCKSISRESGPYEYKRNKTDIEVYLWDSSAM